MTIPFTDVIPAKAGTQYAAAPRADRRRWRLLDPHLRGDDVGANGVALLRTLPM